MPHLTDTIQTKYRLQMIEQAIKDQAPQMYRELKQSARLTAFVQERNDLMMDTFDTLVFELSKVPSGMNPTYLEQVQRLTSARNRAWEETMATWLEFSDPQPESEPTMSSPPAP